MPRTRWSERVFAPPFERELFDSHIDAVQEEPSESGVGQDFVFDVQSLRPLGALTPQERDGRRYEVGRGVYVPLRVRFVGGEWIERSGPFADLNAQPDESGARHLFFASHWQGAKSGPMYWLMTDALIEGGMTFHAREVRLEPRPGATREVEIVRRWSPPPPQREAHIPARPALHRRFGGDPIAIHLGKRVLRRRFFIGGLRHQRAERPQVDAVLNLCNEENPWCATQGKHPADRFATKGEMHLGMDVEQLLAEARWVVERLRAGKTVLVHCYAGVNRSSTVCCAALMLLEGIPAEEALERVRERHPVAWPDPYHWFLLRTLSTLLAGGALDAWVAAPQATPAPGEVTPASAEHASDDRAEADKERTRGAPLLRETAQVG